MKGGWEKGLLHCFVLNLCCLMQRNAGALKHLLKWVRRCLMALLRNLKPARQHGREGGFKGLTWRKGTESLTNYGRTCHRRGVSKRHLAGYGCFRSVTGSKGDRRLRSIFCPWLPHFPALLTVLLVCCGRDGWEGSPAPQWGLPSHEGRENNLENKQSCQIYSWHEAMSSSIV